MSPGEDAGLTPCDDAKADSLALAGPTDGCAGASVLLDTVAASPERPQADVAASARESTIIVQFVRYVIANIDLQVSV
jgi:hypothetical protein